MRIKQLPLIVEVPVIAVGFAAATAGALAYAAVLDSARVVLKVTGLDHQAPPSQTGH